MARPIARIPTHPGEFFRLDVLPHLKLEGQPLTLAGIARAIGLSKQYFHLIVQGKTPMTADVAVRLTKLAGGNPRMWLRMQAEHDLAKAERKLARQLAKIPAADPTPARLPVATLDTRTGTVEMRRRTRQFKDPLLLKVYDGFRKSPPKHTQTGTGFAYHYGLQHPDENPPRTPMIPRNSQAWAAWAAGVDDARSGKKSGATFNTPHS